MSELSDMYEGGFARGASSRDDEIAGLKQIIGRQDAELAAVKGRCAHAEELLEKLREAVREAVAAYGHHYNTQAQGLSVFIRENGRHGSSPWNEWCESMKQLTDAIGETT